MIAAYCRVSSEEQAQNQTIEDQRVKIQDYCRTRELQVEFYDQDDGVSGEEALEERPGGARLLKDLAAGKADRVVVSALDRLGRNMKVLVVALAQIERYAPFESISEGVLSMEDPHKVLITAVQCGLAVAEKKMIVVRTKGASRRLAAKPEAMWMGGVAAYGYRQTGEDREARLALSEEPISDTCTLSEVDVIRLIFQKAADGETCWAIAKHLNNELGIPAAYADENRDRRRGGRNRQKKRRVTKGIWWSSRVRDVILNRTYLGEHVWGKRQWVPDETRKNRRKDHKRGYLQAAPPETWITRRCPAIVTEDLWNQANAALHRNRHISMGHPKHSYLLRGLIRCEECGRTFIGVTQSQANGTGRVYYRCASRYADRAIRDARPRCSSPSLHGKAMEAYVWAEVEKYILRPDRMILEIKSQRAAEEAPGRQRQQEKRKLEERLRGRAEERMHVLDQVGKGNFSDDEIKQKLQRMDEGAADAEKRLAELREISADAEARVLRYDWAGRVLGEYRDEVLAGKLTWEQKRKFVVALVKGIRVPKGGEPPGVTFGFPSDFARARDWARRGIVPAYTGPPAR
jgi:site-specific DNA recombinase